MADINEIKKNDIKKDDVNKTNASKTKDENLVLDTAGGEMPDPDHKSEQDSDPGLAFAKDGEKLKVVQPNVVQKEKKAV